jgi:hypothetical protein
MPDVKTMTPEAGRQFSDRAPSTSRHQSHAAIVFMTCCVTLIGACIDVGHAPEVGCLVDMKEPGCQPSSVDASRVDGDASNRPDSRAVDGFTGADRDARDVVPDSESGSKDGDTDHD